MLTKLMQINSAQEGIIETQAGIIDELFILLCEHLNLDDMEGIDPLLVSMQDAVDRKEKLL
ncbi:MAG: hypothetical protein IKS11_07000 [Lachnospiraceae bacterium]|nr:hypothetical protein [Lachnospiraceae bacterium]